ncbi:MAG TPA: MFS transporter [Solirubrobacteraceae bacterium]|jgi:EmrB/QacA subfamily drug resistance transporter|nr:MFS transporter [Solirubrobacteraceae bacterium]
MDRKWWTLIAVCVAIFMLLLDITVVNVALPSIQRSLHSSFQDLQWVVDAYSLTLAALLLTGGALADLFGRRLLFTIGLVVFTASSMVCGLSSTPLMLNLARGVQGVGGALMFATSLALLAQAFHGRERGTAFGIFGAVTGAAVAAGPLIGGILTSAIGWEWIFFVNVPIGALAVVLTLARVAESRDPNASGVDWAGLVTFSGSLFLLVFALVRGNTLGWGSTEIVAMLSASAVLIVLFVLAERAQKRPMLDLSLFKRPAFVGANLVAFTLSSSAFAMFLYLTLYIQDVLHYSPLQAGLRFLPTTLLMFAVSPLAGRLSVRVPIRLLLGVGLLFVSGGLLAMTAVTPTSGWTVLIPGFVLQGIGVGLINPPLASAAIGVVRPERSGMASGANNTFRQVGIATGIAALGAIFQHDLGGSANAEHASRAAFVGAFISILEIGALVAFAGAVAAFALVRSKDFVASQAPGEAAAALASEVAERSGRQPLVAGAREHG